MKETYYKKQGRKYIPVSEFDSELTESFTKGAYLIICRPGSTLKKSIIDPNYAALIAAGTVAEDAICSQLVKASDLRPSRSPLTEEQLAAWKHLSKTFGEENHALQWPSAREACEAAVEAMITEFEKLIENESVRKAYEHFILMCKLTKKV